MANVYDCWIVAYSDGKKAIAPLSKNAHEVLFIANAKTVRGVGRMTKIIAAFQNKWIGDNHRRKSDV